MSYGYSYDYLAKVTKEYRQSKIKNYENVQLSTDFRNQYGISTNIRNLIYYRGIPVKAIQERGIPSEQALRKIVADKSIERSFELFDKSKTNLRDWASNFFRSNPKSTPHTFELTEQSIWLTFLAFTKPTEAAALCGGSKDDLLWKSIEILKTKKWETFKVGKKSRVAKGVHVETTRDGVLQSFRRKIKPFLALYKTPLNGHYSQTDFECALATLLPKNIGNSNNLKLDEDQRAIVFNLYADGDVKPNFQQIYNYYIAQAEAKIKAGEWTEKSLVDVSTIKNYLNNPDVKQAWYLQRHGEHAYRNIYEVVTKRSRASFANALWVIDGTPAHFYYYDPTEKTAYARLNFFVVLDAHSWCVLGFYVSDSENHEQVKGALRAAVTLSHHLPHQIQSDNGSAIKSFFGRNCIKALAKYYTPARPGNARSKTVEAFFKHFNNEVGRFYPGFTHSPVMGKNINSIPNPEALQLQLKEGRINGKAQAIEMLHKMFSVWNAKKRKNTGIAPIEAYKQSIASTEERQRIATKQVMIEAFWHMPGELKRVKGIDENGKKTTIQQFQPEMYPYTNEGIQIQHENKKLSFVTDNPAFNSKYIGARFAVKFDTHNPSEVYLYQEHKDTVVPFLFNDHHLTLSSTIEFSQALADRKEGEGKLLREHLEKKKEHMALVKETIKQQDRKTLFTGVATKLTPGNAFPKDVISAAKASTAEQLINGEYFLPQAEEQAKPRGNFMPSADPFSEEAQHDTIRVEATKTKLPWFAQD